MFVLLALLLSSISHAEKMPTIYSCRDQKTAVFTWSEGGLLSNPGLEGKIEGPNKESTTVTLVISGKNAMFKGNNGESPLQIIDDTTFLEKPSMGDYVFWRLIPGEGKVPTLLVQFKGYSFVNPYIHAWVFKCS